MAALSTIILGIGVGIAAGGTAMNYVAQKKMAKAGEEAASAQQAAEGQRKVAMNLDAVRRQREIVRSMIAARSQALTTTTAQGAAGAGGSALSGAYGGVSGRSGVNALGVMQNQQIGNNIFQSNQDMYGAYRASAQAGGTAALGQGMTTMGGAMMKNADSISRVGSAAWKAFG